MWTIDELVERVRLALAAQYPGAPNGRVRDVPDRRAIRWYATTGLVDRPTAMRGRTALYGRRHLLQLVAVKRRQADGRTLAEIQAELAGATDATLAGIARVPDELLADDGSTATSPPGNDRTADGSATDAPAEDAMAGTVRARFWVSAPAAATDRPPPDRARREAPGAAPDPSLTPTPPAVIDSTWTDSLSVTLSDDGAAPVHYSRAVPLAGVALGGGAVLLVPGRPADDDYDAIAAAARPLVELLATRGLLASRADAAHGLPGVGGSPPIAGTRAHPDSGRLTHHDGSSR